MQNSENGDDSYDNDQGYNSNPKILSFDSIPTDYINQEIRTEVNKIVSDNDSDKIMEIGNAVRLRLMQAETNALKGESINTKMSVEFFDFHEILKNIYSSIFKAGLENIFIPEIDGDVCLHGMSFSDGVFTDWLGHVIDTIEATRGKRIDVVVIDPFISYFGGKNENDNGEMKNVLDQITKFARKARVTPILVHHDGKDGLFRGPVPYMTGRGHVSTLPWTNRRKVDLTLKSPIKKTTTGHDSIHCIYALMTI